MKCPVCGIGISPGHTVCEQHWKRIPRNLREVLADAFRQRQTDPPTYARAVAMTCELAHTYSDRNSR